MLAATAVAAVIAGVGGTTFGVLVRQPEINALKAQVKRLQEELAHMHIVVKDVMKDIEILQLRLQLEKNQDILQSLRQSAAGASEIDIGTLVYAYGLKEYLEIKQRFLILNESITEKEATFVDAFGLFLDNRVPEGDDGNLAKQYIKEFIMGKYSNEIEDYVAPDLAGVVSTLEEKVQEYEQNEDKAEKGAMPDGVIPELECFTLNSEQTRLLYSLEYRKIEYDIENTDDEKKRAIKTTWRDMWEEQLISALGLSYERRMSFFIKDEPALYEQINAALDAYDSKTWYYLMVLEAVIFVPYLPMSDDAEANKLWKGVKLEADYIKEKFCVIQSDLNAQTVESLVKTYNKYLNRLQNKAIKGILTTVSIVLVTFATGGIASVLAPSIAVLLVGSSFTGLTGVALTNASLAMIGGGAIAAGGLGMAGGTAIITGGGALLGLAAGGGASAVTAMALLSSEGFALRECAKLLTFCKEILLGKNHAKTMVSSIQRMIENRIGEFAGKIAIMESKPSPDKKTKTAIKSMGRSLKFLERTNRELLNLTAE